MLKIIPFITILFFLIQNGICQDVNEIKNSGKYQYGIGIGENYSLARKAALELLSESISVHIKSEFENIVTENNGNLEQYSKSVVKSYSSAVINEYEEKIIKEENNQVQVIVYITKENLQKVFDQRKNIINDFIAQGLIAEKQLRLSDALRYYYWALVLNRSHPENSKLRYNFEDIGDYPIGVGLYDRINKILTNIQININNVSTNLGEKQFLLNITYNNSLVQNLDYVFFTGDGFSKLTSSKDGLGVVILDSMLANHIDNLKLKIEYQYNNKAHLEPEVKLMMENVSIPYFEKAEFKVPLKTIPVNSNINNKINYSTPNASKLQNTNTPVSSTLVKNKNTYQNAINAIILSIQTNNPASVKHLFTTEGFDIYNKLIQNGKVKILSTVKDSVNIIKTNDEVMARSVTMLFEFKNNRERFIEDVVFIFDKNNLIYDLTFGLGNTAISKILSMPDAFGTIEEKYFLIKFLENYKTAYALKRLDYLEAIFNDKALIIVGNVLQNSTKPLESAPLKYSSLSNDQVEYIVLSKKEYIDRLKTIFSRNEFVNITFEDNTIRKTQKNSKIYGIQIAQHYHSSTYADKGYLFLMLDLNDINNPQIYVRSWQPKKNPDGSIIGLEDFKF